MVEEVGAAKYTCQTQQRRGRASTGGTRTGNQQTRIHAILNLASSSHTVNTKKQTSQTTHTLYPLFPTLPNAPWPTTRRISKSCGPSFGWLASVAAADSRLGASASRSRCALATAATSASSTCVFLCCCRRQEVRMGQVTNVFGGRNVK